MLLTLFKDLLFKSASFIAFSYGMNFAFTSFTAPTKFDLLAVVKLFFTPISAYNEFNFSPALVLKLVIPSNKLLINGILSYFKN